MSRDSSSIDATQEPQSAAPGDPSGLSK